MERIKKTLYLDPEEEKALRDEAHEARVTESEVLRHYLKLIYGIKPEYCNRPKVRNCKECSLVSYGRDCQNNPIKEDKKLEKLVEIINSMEVEEAEISARYCEPEDEFIVEIATEEGCIFKERFDCIHKMSECLNVRSREDNILENIDFAICDAAKEAGLIE